MNRYLPLIVIAALAIAIGVGVASMNKDDNKESSTSTPSSTTTTNDNGTTGTSSTTNQSATSTDEVEIEGMAFKPANITVKKGTTVTWTNKNDTAHKVTGKTANGPKSETLNKDDTYSFTFNEVGEFSYFCELHPSMTGKVTVTE